jgi:hypothetical protein
MSRDELADAAAQWLAAHDPHGREVALDGVHIGKLERGVVRRPRNHYVAALCAVLGATEAELGFVAGESSSSAVPALPVPEPWELVDVLTRATVSTATLDHMERAALDCAARYPSTPPRVLLPSVSRLVARVRDILSQPLQFQARKRCVTVLGFLSGLAGNLWFDIGRNGQAVKFFDVGELAGNEANDPDLTAWLLATRSIVPGEFSRS